MVKVGMFNHQISRTLGSRARMTQVRNNIAALRGSSYAPYEQDRLNLEVKNIAGYMDRADVNNDGKLSLYERGRSVVSDIVIDAPLNILNSIFYRVDDDLSFQEFYDEQKRVIGTMNESQTGRVEALNAAIEIRNRMLADYQELLEQYKKEKNVIDSTETPEHKKLREFVTYAQSKLQDPTADLTVDGKLYEEVISKYTRDEKIIQDAKDALSKMEGRLNSLQRDIEQQDKLVKEQAVVAGVDVESGVVESVADATTGFIGPFIIGGIGATILLGIIAGNRRMSPPRRGRRGSAYNVFMS